MRGQERQLFERGRSAWPRKQANSPSTLCGVDVLVTVVSSDGDGPTASTSSTQIIYPDQDAKVARILARCRSATKFKQHPDPDPSAAAAPIKKTHEDGDDEAAVLREDLRAKIEEVKSGSDPAQQSSTATAR